MYRLILPGKGERINFLARANSLATFRIQLQAQIFFATGAGLADVLVFTIAANLISLVSLFTPQYKT